MGPRLKGGVRAAKTKIVDFTARGELVCVVFLDGMGLENEKPVVDMLRRICADGVFQREHQ